MKNTLKTTLLTATLCPFFLVSCAQTSNTGDTYSRYEAGQAQAVKTGKITSVRNVKIEGGSNAGTLLGGIAGGLLGKQIGGSRSANTVGAIAGTAAGAVAGSHIQQSVSSRAGLEIMVRLDKGGSISVVQEANPREAFRTGQRVRVLYNGSKTRVTH